MEDFYVIALKNLVKVHGRKTVAKLAGSSDQSLYQIIEGVPLKSGRRRTVGRDLQERLSAAFPGWDAQIQGSHGYIRLHATEQSTQNNQRDELTIPEFDTGGSMGGGLILRDQPGLIHSWTVNSEWMQKNVRNASATKNLCIVTGFGDSMRPLYNPGDPLLVDRGVRSVEFETVYFFRVGDEGFIKRLQRIPGQGIRVISDNKIYEAWTITKDMDFEVLGRVLKIWRGEEF